MTTSGNRIVRFHETGLAEVLKIEEGPMPEPGEGEIGIAVEAIGLNRAEVMFREGQYLEAPVFPSRLGYEAAGVVTALGRGVTEFAIGDRVSTIPGFSIGRYGVYGDHAVVPARAASHYPQSLSPIEAAAIWMQYITAYGGLIELGGIKAGDYVLITAASSSVGLAAIQIANMYKATPIAVTRGADKKDFLLEAGAEHVVVTNEQDLSEAVMIISEGHGADVIFDPIGGPLLDTLAEAAAPFARIIEYGALAGEPTPFPLFASLVKALSIRGYTLFEITQDPKRLQAARQFVLEGLESGALKPVIDRHFALDEIVEAHRYMESNRQRGKIVVTV